MLKRYKYKNAKDLTKVIFKSKPRETYVKSIEWLSPISLAPRCRNFSRALTASLAWSGADDSDLGHSLSDKVDGPQPILRPLIIKLGLGALPTQWQSSWWWACFKKVLLVGLKALITFIYQALFYMYQFWASKRIHRPMNDTRVLVVLHFTLRFSILRRTYLLSAKSSILVSSVAVQYIKELHGF